MFGMILALYGVALIPAFVVLGVGIAAAIFWLNMLIKAAKYDYENKTMWIILLVLGTVIAAIVFYFVVYKDKIKPRKISAIGDRSYPSKSVSERAILIAFVGNFLVNNAVAAIAAFVPAGAGAITPQNTTFVVLAVVVVAFVAWWYLKFEPEAMEIKAGLWFGIIGFFVSLITTFITGIAGVIVQTGSFARAVDVLPNFGAFLWSGSTLALLGYWVIPATLVGLLVGRTAVASGSPSMSGNAVPQRSI